MSVKHKYEAFKDLMGNYIAVWRHSWQHRASFRENLLNEHEAEFLPAALALQEKPISKTITWTARILILMLIVVLLWSIFGKMEIVVNAGGKIVPSDRAKVITSVDVATIRSILVKDGQKVKAGDVLLVLDASASDAEHDKAFSEYISAHLVIERSKALIEAINTKKSSAPILPKISFASISQWESENKNLEFQFSDYKTKANRIEAEINHLTQLMPIVNQRASDYKNLLKDRDVAEHAWLEKEQALIDLKSQLTDAKNQLAALIAQTKREAQEALTNASKIASSSQQDAKRAGARSNQLLLKTPVDGIVQQLSVHTIGAAVPAAQPLLIVVPADSNIEVEAFVENKDIGFIQINQEVAVKVDAYEYTKYGTIRGKITRVSTDAIQDEKRGLLYSITITLEKSSIMVNDQAIPLLVGMSVNSEIKTGIRRVIEYVLSPLMRYHRETLNER